MDNADKVAGWWAAFAATSRKRARPAVGSERALDNALDHATEARDPALMKKLDQWRDAY